MLRGENNLIAVEEFEEGGKHSVVLVTFGGGKQYKNSGGSIYSEKNACVRTKNKIQVNMAASTTTCRCKIDVHA